MPTIFRCLLTLSLTMSCAAYATPQPLVWTSPSAGSAGSMPIGNGDIGLNVWAQADGSIRTYIAKTAGTRGFHAKNFMSA